MAVGTPRRHGPDLPYVAHRPLVNPAEGVRGEYIPSVFPGDGQVTVFWSAGSVIPPANVPGRPCAGGVAGEAISRAIWLRPLSVARSRFIPDCPSFVMKTVETSGKAQFFSCKISYFYLYKYFYIE